jgi:hypothetical protein
MNKIINYINNKIHMYWWVLLLVLFTITLPIRLLALEEFHIYFRYILVILSIYNIYLLFQEKIYFIHLSLLLWGISFVTHIYNINNFVLIDINKSIAGNLGAWVWIFIVPICIILYLLFSKKVKWIFINKWF